MTPRQLAALLLLALAAAALWRWRPVPHPIPASHWPAMRTLPALPSRPPPHANPNPAPVGPPIDDAPSELANALNSPATDIHADLRLINEIFMHYRSAVHGENPVGENVDITAVLTGRNSLGFAFIPRNHPAINSQGELCDRWGTPFFFHQIAGDEMEIRSAGPDRKLWTADDKVLTP